MNKVHVLGVSMTPFGKHTSWSVKDLARMATGRVLDDAGIPVDAIDAAFFANTAQPLMTGQLMINGQIALRPLGIQGIPVFNVENACASGSSAFHLAWAHIRAGLADVALAIGVEKMHGADKARTMAIFEGGWDISTRTASLAALRRIGEGIAPPPGRETPQNEHSVFMDVYASLARAHMEQYGTTERQLACVAAKNHQHSTANPLAQYRQAFSVEEVLAARMVAWPLTLPMCAPVSDGAAAAILVSDAFLQRTRADRRRVIRIDASVLASGRQREAQDSARHVCHLAARKAYEMAGIGPQDISVAEVHDASAFAEIVQVENLGLCEFGQGGWLAEKGVTRIGGATPVNPSGGLLSKGHPLAATGLGQIHELVTQLRGEAGARQVEGARIAIAENGGGILDFEEAAASITILSNK